MDLLEVDLEPAGYDDVAVFDGRILEIFRRPPNDDSRRIHIKFLSVSVSEQDKNGQRDVVLHKVGGSKELNFALFSKLDPPRFEMIRPLLDALANAGVP